MGLFSDPGARLASLVLLALVPGLAAAQPSEARLQAGGSTPTWLSELRLGLLAHDPAFMNGKEEGLNINGEVLFTSPIPRDWAAGRPPAWRWLLRPRPHLGFSANTAGATSKGYAGLTWTLPLAAGLLRPGDGLALDIFGGGSVNDGLHVSREPDRKSLGSSLGFRVGAELGYRITPRHTVSIFFDHDSNGGLARRNQGLNSLGLRFGIGF